VMHDLVDYCMKRDRSPPDFIQELFEEEKIKEKAVEWMSLKEKQLVERARMDYYQRHCMRLIMEIIPFKRP
jgi:hypothetical protein